MQINTLTTSSEVKRSCNLAISENSNSLDMHDYWTDRRSLSVGFILIRSLLCSRTIETERYWRDMRNSCWVVHSMMLRPNAQPTFTPFTSPANGTSSVSVRTQQAWVLITDTHTQQPPTFYGQYTGQPALAGTSS